MTSAAEVPSDQVGYPPSPWRMVGSMWLSVLRLPHDVDEIRRAGIYGAAFVSYTEGSTLTYSELLVARVLPRSTETGRAVSITDIWVDSPASVAGGRALWAIPKDLCDFDLETSHRGWLSRTEWRAGAGRRPIAAATFSDVSRAAPRLPFRAATWQPALPEGGGDKGAVLRGTARTLPARARWEFATDGPLAFLRDARGLASVRMSAFRMTFGG